MQQSTEPGRDQASADLSSPDAMPDKAQAKHDLPERGAVGDVVVVMHGLTVDKVEGEHVDVGCDAAHKEGGDCGTTQTGGTQPSQEICGGQMRNEHQCRSTSWLSRCRATTSLLSALI